MDFSLGLVWASRYKTGLITVYLSAYTHRADKVSVIDDTIHSMDYSNLGTAVIDVIGVMSVTLKRTPK